MDDVARWLQDLGLGQYASAFADNDVDEEVLLELTDADLEKLGLTLGHRKKLLKAVASRRAARAVRERIAKPPPPSPGVVSEAERRQLTVMFCDLVGSTALAERLDPEELRTLLAEYQDLCAAVIRRYDGQIARYVGDGLLVCFGYPQAHEDDPQRAVRAGLEIVDAIRELSATLAKPDVGLAVRIGVTTGLVVAGDIGRGERVDANAIVGETPNLAARLQALATPNVVLISASTYRLVEGLFECTGLGPQSLKGFSQPVLAYRVRGESAALSGFEAKAARGLTPLVGRGEELALLMERWSQAKDGEGQVVLLCGEAGIGKSRIVRGFRERLEGEAHNRILYYGSAHHRNSAFHPVVDQLQRALRFHKDDTPAGKLDKLDAVLESLALPAQIHAPVLASLLSLPLEDRYPAPELSPEQRKRNIFRTLVDVVEAMASQKPVLMVVEDAHWVDPSTREFIDALIERLRDSRLLLLITYRSELEPPWTPGAHVTSLTLNRLSRKASRAMIVEVAGGKLLPGEVADEIVLKTDGVPLFVEELTKAVLESGLVEDAGDRYTLSGPLPSLGIPASLQDSLMARLDRLGPAKEVAQLAASVGRTFGHELLRAVSPLEDDALEAALEQLLQTGLLYRRGLASDATYEFKHALVQDAAYQSLLKSTRQRYHQSVASALEERFTHIVETQPELLAHHYTSAGRTDRAIPYWRRAGERASARSANLEAIAHLTKGLELIEREPATPERDREELALCLALGPALMAARGYAAPEVARIYVRARALVRRAGTPAQVFAATWGLWLHRLQSAQLRKARALAEEVLRLAERHDDPGLRLQAHHAAFATFYRLAEFEASSQHAQRGIALYDFDAHHHHAHLYGGHDPAVCAHVHAAAARWALGYPDRALEEAHAAVRLGERLSHPFSLTDALACGSRVHQYRREPHLVRERAEAVIALCEEHGFPQKWGWGTIMRGWALAAEGRPQEGVGDMRQGLASVRATGALTHVPYFLALLAEGYALAGQTEEGLAMLAEALDLIERTAERTWEAEIHRLKGELLLMRSPGARPEAERGLERALATARRQGAKSLELRAAGSLAGLWRDQGRLREALDLIEPIYRGFVEGFDVPDIKAAKALLESLS